VGCLLLETRSWGDNARLAGWVTKIFNLPPNVLMSCNQVLVFENLSLSFFYIAPGSMQLDPLIYMLFTKETLVSNFSNLILNWLLKLLILAKLHLIKSINPYQCLFILVPEIMTQIALELWYFFNKVPALIKLIQSSIKSINLSILLIFSKINF
jgi:hypothetical protein